jgi:hypothetical protein
MINKLENVLIYRFNFFNKNLEKMKLQMIKSLNSESISSISGGSDVFSEKYNLLTIPELEILEKITKHEIEFTKEIVNNNMISKTLFDNKIKSKIIHHPKNEKEFIIVNNNKVKSKIIHNPRSKNEKKIILVNNNKVKSKIIHNPRSKNEKKIILVNNNKVKSKIKNWL